ncbi:hypothetical protein [Woeseia oceani]|uniref:Uncharacterized protein n=1 Tax=Woeseia oceani TaxID=1548547 RepID=A0A193LIM5_9GAMM|nr:hypothetical protein [Woeseia oceani]ANO52326.1 hypothetical protein BA177_15040 [Woeseia oceani]
MGFFKAGTKIKFWSPGFKNKPDVRPPGLLLLVSVFFFLSAISVPIFAVFSSLSDPSGSSLAEGQAIYIAFLHFLLPLGVAYSVSANSPLSRILITFYAALLFVATVAGEGYLGNIQVDTTKRVLVSTILFVILLGWLHASPKMRVYYLLLKDEPIPKDLLSLSLELREGGILRSQTIRIAEWFADHLETVVLVGFIVIVVYAFIQTGP